MNEVYMKSGMVRTLQKVVTGSVIYKVFFNDVTPTIDSVIGDFTVDPAFTTTVAPAAFTLTGVSGDAGFITASPIAVVQVDVGTLSAYGYIVTDAVSGDIIKAARFDDAPEARDNGESWFITPTFGFRSQF